MAKIKERGKSGAAKNYITRNQALKKLQCSLSDFRRLCILKGIFPRVPTSAKRANKGSSAPASFYYQKDIQYLLHEPVLAKLREHKAFAKKLSRAIGRGEWGLAKGLEERRPVYRLDHILKERYPTFPDALRDLPDALSLLSLFALLPTTPTPTSTLPATLPANCARLMAEWKLYVMRSKCLKKVFFSIKGVYYQVEIAGEKITWLEGYGFSQHVPTDVDFRILLTFLELHQTLLGFVLFKLYTDINLVYPPPLDQSKDDAGAGYGAFVLTEKPKTISAASEGTEEAAAGSKKKVTTRDVKKGIKSIVASGAGEGMDVDEAAPAPSSVTVEDITDQADDFVEQPSKSADPSASSTLPTFSSLSASSGSNSLTTLFSPYTFYISRSVPRSTAEFILRSFGAARIGWEESSLGLGADFSSPSDPSITHIIVDRPASATGAFVWSEGGLKEGDEDKRAYVQPQWIVDCANEGRLLPTDEYKPGAVLPPHLSPFGSNESRGFASDSRNAGTEGAGSGVLDEETAAADEEESDSDEDDDEEEATADDNMDSPSTLPPALVASSLDPTNPLLLHSAELEAETLGTPLATFEADLAKATKDAVKSGKSKAKGKGSSAGVKAEEDDEDLRKIMMSNKQKKLYEKMNYSNKQKSDEQLNLERKRNLIKKEKAKADKKASSSAKKSKASA